MNTSHEGNLIPLLKARDRRIAELEAENKKLKIADAKSYGMYCELLFSTNEPPKSLEAHNLGQQIKILKEYANINAILRQEPSTRSLYEKITELEQLRQQADKLEQGE